MPKLYFRYGAMGSSKSANALMTAYNYNERGKKALLAKPSLDTREPGMIQSRIGLKAPCFPLESVVGYSDEKISEFDCLIIDEAQFCTKENILWFEHVVDDLHIPVICYGLRTDFRRNLFEGSKWLLAWADEIEELKTVCWCGKGASCNTRYDDNGNIVKNGEQIVIGGNEKYISLCRKHYKEGLLSDPEKQMK